MYKKRTNTKRIVLGLGVLLALSQPVFAEENSSSVSKTEPATEVTSEQETDTSTSGDLSETSSNSSSDSTEINTFLNSQPNDGKQIDQNLLKTDDANTIRNLLLADNYGIDKATLDNYTDEQLLNAMTVFERYNSDLGGMDLSAYVRVLHALYQDHTLSFEKISQELTFMPNNFQRFSEMTTQIDSLQSYLHALYPSNSSFVAAKKISNQELITLLTQLNTFEEKLTANGEKLPSGRIFYILQAIETGVPSTETTTTSSEPKTETVDSKKASSAAEKNKDKLPQTGETKQGTTLIIFGGLVLILVIGGFVWKNKKKNE